MSIDVTRAEPFPESLWIKSSLKKWLNCGTIKYFFIFRKSIRDSSVVCDTFTIIINQCIFKVNNIYRNFLWKSNDSCSPGPVFPCPLAVANATRCRVLSLQCPHYSCRVYFFLTREVINLASPERINASPWVLESLLSNFGSGTVFKN